MAGGVFKESVEALMLCSCGVHTRFLFAVSTLAANAVSRQYASTPDSLYHRPRFNSHQVEIYPCAPIVLWVRHPAHSSLV
jgi:hypothetical protein